MTEPTNVVRRRQPDDVDDALIEDLRARARHLLTRAVELQAEVFLAGRDDLCLPDGRLRLVRHGHGPERQIKATIGPVPVSCAKIRDGLRRGPAHSAWKVVSYTARSQ